MTTGRSATATRYCAALFRHTNQIDAQSKTETTPDSTSDSRESVVSGRTPRGDGVGGAVPLPSKMVGGWSAGAASQGATSFASLGMTYLRGTKLGRPSSMTFAALACSCRPLEVRDDH